METGRCGTAWPGDAARAGELRCQREPGHDGAHLVDVAHEDGIRRYWWLRWAEERGVNFYPPLVERAHRS